MNLFILDTDIDKCAHFHVDKHAVKMVTETAQMLSTAHRVLDGSMSVIKSPTNRNQKVWSVHDSVRETSLYKSTHINHPCSVWIRQSSENYNWVYSMLAALSQEYTRRYGKVHKIFRTELHTILSSKPDNIRAGSLTPFALAMPDQYKVSDPVESYRNYYREAKKHIHSWKHGKIPEWI